MLVKKRVKEKERQRENERDGKKTEKERLLKSISLQSRFRNRILIDFGQFFDRFSPMLAGFSIVFTDFHRCWMDFLLFWGCKNPGMLLEASGRSSHNKELSEREFGSAGFPKGIQSARPLGSGRVRRLLAACSSRVLACAVHFLINEKPPSSLIPW